MFGLIKEGKWKCRVDERSRFQLPAEIRKEFGLEGTWAREPNGSIVLFVTKSWREKAIKTRNPEKFREAWEPFDIELDSHGRMTIPPCYRNELGQEVLLRSIRGYLKIQKNAGISFIPADMKEGGKLSAVMAKEAQEVCTGKEGVIALPCSGARPHGRVEKCKPTTVVASDSMIPLPPGCRQSPPLFPPAYNRWLAHQAG